MIDSRGEQPKQQIWISEISATCLYIQQSVDILLICGFLGALLMVEISKLEKAQGDDNENLYDAKVTLFWAPRSPIHTMFTILHIHGDIPTKHFCDARILR